MQTRDRSPMSAADHVQTGFNPLARLRFKLSELVTAKTAAPAKCGARELSVLAVREEQTVVVEQVEDTMDTAVTGLRNAAKAMQSRRGVLGGLAALPSLVPDVVAASEPPVSEPDTSRPLPTEFDPISYIAEMRAAGVVLTPNYRNRTFSITGQDGQGIPMEMMDVTMKWDQAAVADPDWIGRVFRVLAAERSSGATAAVPVSDELMWSYKNWLHMEHRMLSWELAGYDGQAADQIEDTFVHVLPPDRKVPNLDWHMQWARDPGARGPAGWITAPQPSSRAAAILAAAGVDLTDGGARG